MEELFEEETLIEWFGMTSHAKSLVLMDLCLSMTRGPVKWCGRKILKPGPVVWINADGGRGITKRARAWREANGGEFQYPFRTYMGAVRLNRHDEITALLDDLKRWPIPPALIVFDTLSRCIPGTDENLQGPMTLVTDECHRLKLGLGATIALIHHTDKSGERDRGSSVVKNEADYVFRVSKDEATGIITVESDKARDGEKFRPFYLKLQPVGASVVVVQNNEGPPPKEPAERITQVRHRTNQEEVVQIVADAERRALDRRDETRRADFRLLRSEFGAAGHQRGSLEEISAGAGCRRPAERLEPPTAGPAEALRLRRPVSHGRGLFLKWMYPHCLYPLWSRRTQEMIASGRVSMWIEPKVALPSVKRASVHIERRPMTGTGSKVDRRPEQSLLSTLEPPESLGSEQTR